MNLPLSLSIYIFCPGLNSREVERRSKLICNVLESHVPPCVRYAVVALWSNAWVTSGRFQQEAPCLFCGQEKDDLGHLACCPLVWRFFFERMFLICLRDIENFFLIDSRDEINVAKWAMGIYALYMHHNDCRIKASSGPIDWDIFRAACWGHCKIASLFHSSSRIALNRCRPIQID